MIPGQKTDLFSVGKNGLLSVKYMHLRFCKLLQNQR